MGKELDPETEAMFAAWEAKIEADMRLSGDAFIASVAGLPRYMTPEQAAEALNVSTQTIRRRIADGSLQHLRMGRLIRIPTDALRPFFIGGDAA